jgi:hypothetical protein
LRGAKPLAAGSESSRQRVAFTIEAYGHGTRLPSAEPHSERDATPRHRGTISFAIFLVLVAYALLVSVGCGCSVEFVRLLKR